MPKRKYASLVTSETFFLKQASSCNKFMQPHTVPRLLPYSVVQTYVKSLPRPTIVPFEGFPGFYIPLSELLATIVPVYLARPDTLSWWEEDVLSIAVGGDGAPMSQTRSMHVMLVSVVNSTKTVAGIRSNHILMAGEVSETDPRLEVYYRSLCDEMESLQASGLLIDGKKFKVSFDLFPCDQKFHAHLAGELTNAATYPSTYANLKKGDLTSQHGSLSGRTPIPSIWKP